MIIFRFYDPEEKVDYVWYKSSNVAFSKCDDKVNDYKDLTVVFNNGATYKYKKVNVNDYLMFVAGGTNGSNGKALNTFIKKNCEFEKLEPTDFNQLEQLKNQLKLKKLQTTETTTTTAGEEQETDSE